VGAPYGAFTHVARRMGGVAGANAVDGGSREVDPDVGPRAIFTDPEVATIGLTEAAAREAGHEVSVAAERFSGGKARAWGEEHGLAKVVCEAGTGRILGAAVLAYHGADLIHPVAVAMQAPGGAARPLIDAYHVHPTMGEVVQRAVSAAAAG
jgi:dihydrolipoamide dehydrogenase